jgi:hypothetical protein
MQAREAKAEASSHKGEAQVTVVEENCETDGVEEIAAE